MDLARSLLAAGALALAAAVLLTAWRIRGGWDPVVAVGRAGLQLALLSLLLAWILGSVPLSMVWLAVMLAVAVVTAARRIGADRRAVRAAAAGLGLSTACVLSLVFAIGAVPAAPPAVLAFGGILIGNTMTVCALAGGRLQRGLAESRDEVEGWLALGASPRQATRRLRAEAIRDALAPSLDQTRVTGLVTLPGAFVGALFAGSPPEQAAVFQLLVLAGVAAGGAIAAIVVTELMGAPRTLPDPGPRPERAEHRACPGENGSSPRPERA